MRKGSKMSEEQKLKLSVAHKGKPSPKKGIRMSEEQKKKISNTLKSIPKSEEFKRHLSKVNRGRVIPEEQKKRISASLIRWHREIGRSKETCEKISKANKGHIHSKEHKQKIKKKLLEAYKNPKLRMKLSRAQTQRYKNPKEREKLSGEKSSNWCGGISKLPYAPNWTKLLKEKIRQRDNYTCRLCSIKQEELQNRFHRLLSIHHIDYDKMNCDSDNLISLCTDCHAKTNYGRKKWKRIFTTLIKHENL